MKSSWMTVRAASVLLGLAGGCSMIAGLNNEYEQEGASPSGGGGGGGGGGGAGGGMPCTDRGQCQPDTDCTTWACVAGNCTLTLAPDETPLQAGTVGDCKKNVCKDGKPAVLPDDTDLIPDNDPCSVELCKDGVKLTGPAPDGTACGETGKLACANGLCEGCVQDPSSCNAPTECQTVECPVNTCVYSTQEGKVLDDSSAMDCKVVVCDAQGNKATVGDLDDTPPQMGDDCKAEVCAMDGSVAQMNANEGIKCADPMGACYNDSVCEAGACAAKSKPAGTKVGDNGAAGDCKASVCDGSGGTTEGPDDSDVPPDPDPGDCLYSACVNGVPTSATKAKGDVCSSAVNGKCCGTNCCANAAGGAADFCDQNDMCCPSNKACGGVCCSNSFAGCANNACCEGGNVCNDVCCPTSHACDDIGDCCPPISRCGNGSCCPGGAQCKATNQCGPAP
jgi:hypothetical protein